MSSVLIILIVINILGIINTIYLSYHAIRGTRVYCLFLPEEWCIKVQESKYSKTLGIPNPYLGFGMLTVILVLTLLYSMQIIPFYPAMVLISFGFLFSMYFLYIQAFVIKAFCTWCIFSALVFTALFIVQFFMPKVI